MVQVKLNGELLMFVTKYTSIKYIFTLIMLSTLLFACTSNPQVYNVHTGLSPDKDDAQAQKRIGLAILSASRFYEPWTISKVRSGLMRGVLGYSGHVATVSIPYDANSFQIIYTSSSNFAYDESDQTIHSRYNDWVKKLESRINEEIYYQNQLFEQD
jgi:hypothetical protein